MITKYSIKFPITTYNVKVIFTNEDDAERIKNLVIFNDNCEIGDITDTLFSERFSVESISFMDVLDKNSITTIYSK